MGYGGQLFAETVLGWSRVTIRKALAELESGCFEDHRKGNSGRKKTTEHLPDLEESIHSIVKPNSQTDPTFRSTRIYTPLTARQVRNLLINDFYFKSKDLPSRRTISTLMNKLGYVIKKVQKSKPKKKIPETDEIFETLKPINKQADEDPGCLRISIDAKASVGTGALARGGKSRQFQRAVDHDFDPIDKFTPYGLFIPESNQSWIWFSQGPVTSDFIVDRIEEIWPILKEQYNNPHTLIINADNGPECSGRRTQWLNRLVKFADKSGITIRLAYYPPYHSKYNPIERFWGVLENHWNGEILYNENKMIGLARSMTYNGVAPKVRRIKKIYQKGISLSKTAMKHVEKRLQRMPDLEKWFISINPASV